MCWVLVFCNGVDPRQSILGHTGGKYSPSLNGAKVLPGPQQSIYHNKLAKSNRRWKEEIRQKAGGRVVVRIS